MMAKSIGDIRFALLISLVFVLFAPSGTYLGDPTTSQTEAFAIVYGGKINVPLEKVRMVQSAANEGQYFVWNKVGERYVSKYGVAVTLFYLPQAFLYKKIGSHWKIDNFNSLWLFILNTFNLVLVFFYIFFLKRFAELYSRNKNVITTFVLLIVFSSYVFYYLRAQSSEILQMVLFLGWFISLKRKRWISSWMFLFFLIHTKVFYAVLVLFQLYKNRSKRDVIPLMFLVSTAAAVFYLKFGSAFLTGYHQWHPEYVTFKISSLKESIYGFLFSPLKSIFIHVPAAAAGLFGIKAFRKKHPQEFKEITALVFTTAFLIALMPAWSGDAAYGPRYLLFLVPLLSLPLITVLESVAGKVNALQRSLVPLIVLMATMIFGIQSQVAMLQPTFFAYFSLKNSWLSLVVKDNQCYADTNRFLASRPQSWFAKEAYKYLNWNGESDNIPAFEKKRQECFIDEKDFRQAVKTTYGPRNILWGNTP